MIEAVGALAVPVGKLLLKASLGAGAADVGGSLLQLAFKRLGDRQKAAEAEAKARAVGEAVVADLGRFLTVERGREGDLRAAADELGTTIGEHVGAELLVGRQLDAGRIAQAILDARPPDQMFKPGDPAGGYYRQLVAALAPRLREIAPELAGYATARDAELLGKLDQLGRTVPGLLAAIDQRQRAEEGRRRGETEAHEGLYRRALERRVGELTLFGVDLDERTPRELPLSIAYIPLRLRLDPAGEDKSLTLEFAELLALLPLLGGRLLVEGAAGSGKTTLLQWTALEALLVQAGRKQAPLGLALLLDRRGGLLEEVAEHHPGVLDAELADWLKTWRLRPRTRGGFLPNGAHSVKPWHERTPFLVRLRDCPEGRLPEPAGLPSLIAHGAGSPAEDWVRARLLNGNALVLLDGIDEVPDARRRDIRESIENYFDHYGSALFVVSSRPAAVRDPAWGALFGPCRVAVQPMAPVDIERFVEQWHEALAAKLRATADRRAVGRLTSEILASGGLQQLAQTPLLCAAICYLHRVREGELPRRLSALYDKLCELLIHRLDRARFEREGQERLTAALRGLELEDRRAILAALAHFMVREETSTLDVARGAERVREVLAALRKLNGRDPADVLDGLQERSGVLRGASPHLVEFAHNGLRSHLAATVFSREASLGDLVSKALATDDHDLPVLAAALGGDGYRDGLVREFVRRADTSGDREAQRALWVMAARCGATGGVSAEVAALLRSVERKVLPPVTLAEAGRLAELGERALPKLARKFRRRASVAAASVRCLRLIGGEQAERLLEAYLDHNNDDVVAELAQTVENPLRIRELLSFILTNANVYKLYEPVRHIKSSDLNVLNSDVTSVHLVGARVDSLEWIIGFEKLRRLILAGTAVNNITPLTGLKQLQVLSLAGTKVVDLSPLADLSNLMFLDLSDTDVKDFTSLATLSELKRLSLSNTKVTDLVPLTHLAGLERLEFANTSVVDVAALARLAELEWLVIAHTAVSDLSPLIGLNKLRHVVAEHTAVSPDSAPIAELSGRGVKVYL